MPDREALLAEAREMVRGRGRLLFLCFFGSTLYGTRREGSSDTDLRGLWLPDEAPENEEAMARVKGLHRSTGVRRVRNTHEDTDIDLVSAERWLCRGLAQGDTGSLDLLYAPTNPPCVLFCHPALEEIFASPLRFLNLADGGSCESYCRGQGNTFGMRGTRLGALWRVRRALEGLDPGLRLERRAEFLAQAAGAPDFCSVAEDGGLLLAGQRHMAFTKTGELVLRLDRMLAGHRERIEAAREGRDVDWKALSHALRAIRQQESLLRDGTLRFPLACREEILRVKEGGLSFACAEDLICSGLEGLRKLRSVSPWAVAPDGRATAAAASRLRERAGGA